MHRAACQTCGHALGSQGHLAQSGHRGQVNMGVCVRLGEPVDMAELVKRVDMGDMSVQSGVLSWAVGGRPGAARRHELLFV